MPVISVAERQRRAARYLEKMGPAIEGSGGDAHTYAACRVGIGFDLEEVEFWPVLTTWNLNNSPPWDERMLHRKLTTTYRRSTMERGSLIRDRPFYRTGGRDDDPDPFKRTEHDPTPISRRVREPSYPPLDEVLALWERALSVERVPEAGAWLRSRGIEYGQLGEHRNLLIRAIPRRAATPDRWPSWAVLGRERPRPWTATGFRAVLPLFDPHGSLRSMKARWIEQRAAPPGLKSVPPQGYDVARLFLASPIVAFLLHHGAWPDHVPQDQRVIHMGEGEPDFLSLVVGVGRSRRPHAGVLGYFQGSFSFDLFRRLPHGTVLFAHGQDDEAGRAYIDKLRTTFAPVLTTRQIELRIPKSRRPPDGT